MKRKLQQPRRGVTTLVVQVSTAGRLSLLAGPKNRAAGARAEGAGRVRLTVKPKGRAVRTLKRKSKVKITVKLRFRSAAGAVVTRRVPVTIRRKR